MKKAAHATLWLMLILGILLQSCSTKENYETAALERKGDRVFLKLRGRRPLMSHDPISLVIRKTYEDSISFDITSIERGFVDGASIPVPSGNYKMLGSITISKQKATIALKYANTDDSREDPLSWNGEYKILEK